MPIHIMAAFPRLGGGKSRLALDQSVCNLDGGKNFLPILVRLYKLHPNKMIHFKHLDLFQLFTTLLLVQSIVIIKYHMFLLHWSGW